MQIIYAHNALNNKTSKEMWTRIKPSLYGIETIKQQ